jgi:hypothetical protein
MINLSNQPTIDLRPEDRPTSDPQPDVVHLNRCYRSIASKARPAEFLLIAEVFSSTLYLDLTAKTKLYGRSGIPETGSLTQVADE